jgi:hypothetical protein
MIFDFQLLAEKIDRLVELARTLRRENAELRLSVSALADENAELARRMVEAHERVTVLLEKIPLPTHDEETA